MSTYMPRLSDIVLQEHLSTKGAVLIEGPKWCGKTTTAKQNSKSFIEMDRPDQTSHYLQMASINPSYLLQGETPHLIDEWQIAPSIWDAVRHEVDQRGEFGQFIITGSALPPKINSWSHTGTGRIVRMRMRPMSLYESQDSDGLVSLADLFDNREIQGKSDMTLDELAYLICRGGWPIAAAKSGNVALSQALDYYDSIVHYDILRTYGESADSMRTAKLIRSLARNVSTQVSLETIRKDCIANDIDTFDKESLYSYLVALNQIFVIEDAPAWNPNVRSKVAIRSSNTRYFVDPSIATAALGLGPQDLLRDLNLMGLLFENLCVRDLRVYTEPLHGELYHYRDKYGLECDAVLHLRDGRYGLVEIKLGGTDMVEEAAANLLKFSSRLDTDKMHEPSFMMVLVGVAPFAYKRPDGIYVVPISCLKN